MLSKWLEEKTRDKHPYTFNVCDISEKNRVDEEILDYLSKKTLISYRSIKSLKKTFSSKPAKELKKYLKKYVFPSVQEIVKNGEKRIRKNVRKGDLGEIITALVVTEFRGLVVPFYKLRWKFNNNRSIFCTDILAHNKGKNITDLFYYEVKTRTTLNNKIAIEAHDSLKRDIPNESIADFLQRYYSNIAETLENQGKKEASVSFYDIAEKYSDIVNNPSNYSRKFEIVLVLEKSEFREKVLTTLNALPPTLSSLTVTIILVDNLNNIVKNTHKKVISYTMTAVYGDEDG